MQSKTNHSLPINKIIKICQFIINQCYFNFNNDFYRYKFKLPVNGALGVNISQLYILDLFTTIYLPLYLPVCGSEFCT